MAKRIGDLFRKTERKLRNQEADAVTVRSKGGQPGNKNAVRNRQNTNGTRKEIISTIRFDKPIRGTTVSYAMRRLEKSRPDLHAKCLSGELTAHAAMIEAGLRKKPKSRKKSILKTERKLRN